jgi:hypothetical protein
MNKEWNKVAYKSKKEKLIADLKAKYSISDEDVEKLMKL